ncbi:MAG: amidohydrolase [Pseudobdellovibrionaceae bacterium]
MLLKISHLYDSHVHWLGTGQIAVGLQLYNLKNAEDIAKIKVEPSFFRGEWLVGFGWDHTKWPDKKLPNKEVLDQLFPEFPVMLQRADGHCTWLNSIALAHLGFGDTHSGILQEEEHFKAYYSLPKLSDLQIRQSLKRGCGIFNQAGFTHIRDMTCDEQQWRAALALEQAGELTLYVQENFLCEYPQDIDRVLALLEKAKLQETPHLKAQGIKIFFDGTLGSDTAWLSKCKCTHFKFSWTNEDLATLLKKAWSKGFEVAVHTIGDEAAHQVVLTARQVMATNKHTGWLNLEHVEVLRPETLQKLKALHVRCHMQPCHWLSDRAWLKEKLGDLYNYAFPWGALSRSGIPLYLGSDSPVANPSFWDNQKALTESVKEKIPPLAGEISAFHSFPEQSLGETYTVFENQKLHTLVFDGKKLY